jgi:hypothetical protein
MEHFNREYMGDNENRAWIRETMESKGFKVDHRKVIMRMSKGAVGILFDSIMRKEFPEYE